MKLNGTVPRTPVSIAVHHSTVQFTAGGINYSLSVPDSVVTFSPTTTAASTTFDTANNEQPVWLESQLNPQPSGNTLLQAFAFPMPAGGLPGGIKNVTWTSSFSSDTANITLNWQWAAAVYTGCVNSAYNSDEVKPTDDNTASIYKNSDHAGTPEACKSFVTQGATGGGASNYTGSLSGTASVTPPLVAAAPVITGTISPAPNGNGWNNTNVTVRFSCSDANFAIATCPAPVTVSSEGAAQIITGTAVDQAGNGASSSTSVTINLDKGSPSIIATATSPSGNGGVLTLPVTVTFTCADSVSGVDSCPASIQVTSAGANETFSGTAIDKAGNTASTSIALNTQSAPLAITASISPAPINGWNKTDVTISYQCTGGVPPVQCPQPVTVTAEGAARVISATATDAAGQPSSIATTLNIDKTAPTISAEAAPVANAAGWNTEDVTITYTCSDSLSGIAVCPQPRVVSVEGKAQVISASVSDVAGNTASANTTINLEKTAPLITGSITPAPNAAGWNNSDVTVNFTCTPSVSDIVSCPPPVPVTQGMGQEISGSVTDQAGKSNSASVTVNIDKIPPVITAVISPQPNAAGWNNTPVTVTFTCSDAGSGIAACSGPIQVSTEGSNQVVVGMATDQAGNTVQIPVTLKIDTTPPIITSVAAPQPNAAGWNTTPVTITYACSDSLSGVQACPQPQVAGTEGKAQQYTASVTDQAGNTANSVVLLNIEFTAPSITTLLTPLPNAGGWNNTDVTVNFNCVPSASDIVSCPAPVLISAEGRGQTIPGTVTDQAGKSATATALVNLDKTPPLISASAAPPANAAGWNNTDVTITYLCSDGLSGIAVCPSPTAVSSEGAAESFSAQAVDQAGNFSTISTTLNIDKTPPIVTGVTAPPANGAGWNNTDVTVTYSCSDGLSGVASCPSTAVISSEGQNQSVPGQARDVAGNAGTAAVTVSIDKTAPTIIQITAPDHISRLHGGQVSVTVTDNFSVSQVVISANDTPLGTFSTAPYQVDLQVPVTANPGDTVTVTVQATDAAGNTQMSSRGVRVSADGVVVGQVLSDVTSFPIPGAVVQAITKASLSDQTNDHGRYSLQVSDSHLFVTATSATPATTTVEREVFVQEGVGTVPVDARLTPLASPVAIGSAGGTLVAGNLSIAVPAATVGDGTSFQLTPLSGQGLPGLLPLGWSPVAAFDLRATSSAANLPANFSKLPNVVGDLVLYNPALHAWTMVASNLQVINGGLTVMLPAPASYALVVPDLVDPPIVIPAPGDPLTGINMQQLSPQASSSGALSPATLPPSGGTSTATLGVQSVTYVPSGTVIQANVSEKFSLRSGSAVSDEVRSEDIVLYGALAPTGSSLGARFPVAPSHKFANTELLTGEVHLDILAGREGVRGQPGGSDPLTLSDGTSTLFVPGGELSEDTAISVQSIALEDFIPVSSTLNALQETLVDFSGETLTTPAQLSIPAIALDPTHTFLLARVERLDGVPRMVATALARINGANLTTVASPGLPGVVQGGEYVFYDITAPVGFAQGVVSSSAGPVQAVVQSDSLPIADITGADGHYIVPALAGTVNLNATVPHTNLIGSVSAPVVAGQTVVANITLLGTVTNAVLSPADGSLGVPASTVITVTTTAPLNSQSIQQANLVLLKSGAPVALQPFVLSNSGTVLSFAPQKNLDPATQYTIHVSGLADIFGGAIIVPSATFTTKAVAPPNFNPNAITFSFPDANGNIHVSAPAGSLPPGTRVMIVDQTNAFVLSLTTLNDGSVSGDFPGTINDVLQVTVTDPNGATATFTRSQFVAPDGTVAVGAGGGTVTGPGGVELRIPDGALDTAATFKIETFGPELFPERPDLPGGNFGSGLKVTSPEMPIFKKEVKLAFPKPADAPDGAFFYVYRRMTNMDGSIIFQTIDHAMVEGEGAAAKVVTASPPFSGYSDSYGSIATFGGAVGGFVLNSLADQNFMMEWTFDKLLIGIASQDVIVGKVLRTVPPAPGKIDPTFEPVAGAIAWRTDDATQKNIAISGSNGVFSLFTSKMGTATINITVRLQTGEEQKVDAIVVNTSQPDDFLYFLLPDTYRIYKSVARTTVTFAPRTPPPPAPKVEIHTFQGGQGGVPRKEVFGLAVTGTSLIIGFKSTTLPLDVNSHANAFVQQDSDGSSTPIALLSDFDSSSNKMDLIGFFTPGQPGSYRVTIVVPSVFGGPPVTISNTFLVIADGGGNNQAIPGTAPDIISALLVPQDQATNVATDTLLQIVFTQPVVNVANNIALFGNGHITDFTISAVGVDAQSNHIVIPDLSQVSANTAVTAVTLQPKGKLTFDTSYQLLIGTNIFSTGPNPLPLQGRTYTFTTTKPQPLSSIEIIGSMGIFVTGNRAFITSRESNGGTLHAFDISNPLVPSELAQGHFSGMAVHMAGAATSSITPNGTLLAVASTQFTDRGPSNIWLFQDLTQANAQGVVPAGLQRIGAVSLTGSTEEGTILRVALKDNFAYAITYPHGLEVVDLSVVKQKWDDASNNPLISNRMFNALANPGQGWATDAIVNIIPLPGPNGGFAQTPGLAVDDFQLADGSSQTLVLTSGTIPLTIIDPQTGQKLFNRSDALPSTLGSLTTGWALALGRVPDPAGAGNDRRVAVIVGYGSAPADPFYQVFEPTLAQGPVMAILDVTTPGSPVPLGFFLLDSASSDVQVNGTTAYVSTASGTSVIDFSIPAKPRSAGVLPGRGGHLAFADPGLLLSTTLGSTLGLHIIQLSTLRCSTLGGTGIPAPPSSPGVNHVNWTMDVSVDPGHGLTVQNVKLGPRHMADSISVPYFTFAPVGHPATRCQLKSGGALACDSAADALARSRLAQFQTFRNAGNLTIAATYVIDRLFGDPEAPGQPKAPQACVVVTEKFEFDKTVPGDACEASGAFVCTRFKPTVQYQYFHDDKAPDLSSLQIAEKLHFNVQEPVPPTDGTQLQNANPSNAIALFHDCDGFLSLCFGSLSTATLPSLLGLHVVKAFDSENPLLHETAVRVVQGGQPFAARDDKGATRTIDNIHQSSQGEVDEPGLNAGCPDCVHVHWRWDAGLNHASNPLIPERFDAHQGLPIIPPGSDQDIDIAIIRSDKEDQNPNPISYLDLLTTRGSVDPTSGNPQPVLWYVGTGHKPADQFFIHGGFFSTTGSLKSLTLTNISAVPVGGGQYTINFTGTGVNSFLNYQISAIDPVGGTFSQASGPTFPNVPVSVTFTPNPGGLQYIVEVSMQDTTTLQTAVEDILIQVVP
jgi:hypothetical protein